MKIALIGNPNSGKTTMFNRLTGRNEKVGNWTGVTVEKKEGYVKKRYAKGQNLIAVDLPGAYSLSAYTSEESITDEYVKNENPDIIINIVDAESLNRSLFFTTQLLELGIPTVIALNKSDLIAKKGIEIDESILSETLGCPVIKTVSTSNKGLDKLISTAMDMCGKSPAPFKALKDDRLRFEFANKTVELCEVRSEENQKLSATDKLDRVLTNKWLGIPIFALIMFLVFEISQVWIGTPIADFLVGILESFQGYLGGLAEGSAPIISAILIDGIVGGVIAVIGFLPLVMVMYFLIALLEDCGYMSRAAVVLDPIFKKVGLSGRSVIPFVITIGCAVPGIMASRTIKNERERKATIMLAPFMPCGAKIPVIALFAGAFFGGAGWVSALVYLLGIALIFIGALVINLITGNNSKKSFFIIELPEYKIPSLLSAAKMMLSRGWAYIVKAATIILLCNTAVQIMQSFAPDLGVAQTADSSILAMVAKPIAYLIAPIVGVVSWQLAAAAVTGFIAKENVVGTLAVCFAGLQNLIDTEELTLIAGTGAEASGIIAISKVAALSYLMFNLYTPPCFAAIGAMNSEMKSKKWLWGGISLQFGVGYTVAYLIYTVGTLIIEPANLNILYALIGLAIALTFIGAIAFLIRKNNQEENF